jgi:hypothetical protein
MRLGLALLFFALPAAACVVGDPGGPPAIAVTTSPPDRCCGNPAGTVAGTVMNVHTDSVEVAVYVEADVYYRQTEEGGAPIQCPGGGFSTPVYGGCRYSAVLARRGWDAPAQLIALPPLGGPILAVASSLDSAPHPPRGFLLWDHPWLVKSFCGEPTGPGMNRFADDSLNVSVAGDTLRLRMTNRGGEWYASEIYSAGYLGYGMFQFQVEGRVDLLDPNLVASGFILRPLHDRSRRARHRVRAAGRPRGAERAVRRPARLGAPLLHDGGRRPEHAHGALAPDRIEFSCRQGAPRRAGRPIASWTFTVAPAIPSPDFERMRFILWRLEGPGAGLAGRVRRLGLPLRAGDRDRGCTAGGPRAPAAHGGTASAGRFTGASICARPRPSGSASTTRAAGSP